MTQDELNEICDKGCKFPSCALCPYSNEVQQQAPAVKPTKQKQYGKKKEKRSNRRSW